MPFILANKREAWERQLLQWADIMSINTREESMHFPVMWSPLDLSVVGSKLFISVSLAFAVFFFFTFFPFSQKKKEPPG